MDDVAPPTISVTGTGRVARPPDLAEITIGVAVSHPSVAEATADAGIGAAAVVTSLRGVGIDDDDLQTSSYSVSAEYDHRSQPRRLLGYRVANSVRVTVRAVERLSDVLSAATEAGGDATTINRLDFRLSDPATAEREARALAWADALATARQLADLAGVGLGPARRIVDGAEAGPVFAAGITRGVGAMAEAAPIEAGTLDVEVAVAVDFELDRLAG